MAETVKMPEAVELPKPRIAICTQVYNHVSFDVYFNHMWCIAHWAKLYDLVFIGKGGTDTAGARNAMIERCFEKNCTHAFFMDGDHLFPSGAITFLLENGHEAIVSGLVCKRGEEFQQIGWVANKDGHYLALELPLDGKVWEVAVCAFGCTLVNLAHLRNLTKPYFRDTCEVNPLTHEPENIRSDINICKAFRNSGQRVWIDTRVLIGHEGIPSSVYPQNRDVFRSVKQIEYSTRKLREGQQGVWYEPM